MTIGLWGALIVAAFLALLLRRDRPELALGIGLSAGVGAAVFWFRQLKPVVDTATLWFGHAGLDATVAGVLFKSLGLCLLAQFCVNVCRDAGEQGLAAYAELAGKSAILLTALPLFRQLLDLAIVLIKGGDG